MLTFTPPNRAAGSAITSENWPNGSFTLKNGRASTGNWAGRGEVAVRLIDKEQPAFDAPALPIAQPAAERDPSTRVEGIAEAAVAHKRSRVPLPQDAVELRCARRDDWRKGRAARPPHQVFRAGIPTIAITDPAHCGHARHGVAKEWCFETGRRDISGARRHDRRYEPRARRHYHRAIGVARLLHARRAAGCGHHWIASDRSADRNTRNDRSGNRRAVDNAAVCRKLVRSRRDWSRGGRRAPQARA